jgi:peptide/nickel transport system substrate-binding protein
MAVQSLPTTLDIIPFQGAPTRQIQTLLDSELWNYNDLSCSTAPTATNLTGWLAKSSTVSPDRKTITVTLKDEKSPYGHTLSSADVAWSLQRAITLSPIVKFLAFANIHLAKDPVTVVSPTVFKINLSQPTPIDEAMFTVPGFGILDSTEAKAHASPADPWASVWLTTHSDGYGPWQVSAYYSGNEIILTRNPGWTGAMGNISTVVVKQIANSAQQAELMPSGEVQYSSQLTWSEYRSLQKDNNGTVKVYACAPFSRDTLVLQQADPRFAKAKVRQAISMAINRQAMVTAAYAGYGGPALTGWLPSSLPPGANVVQTEQNVTAAKALLASAGYPHGFAMTLTYNPTQPGPQVEELAILLKAQLAQIGITLTLQNLSSAAQYTTDQFSGKFQAIISSESPAVPSEFFDAAFLAPTSPINTFHYNNPAYTAQINALGAAAPGSAAYNAALIKLANMNITSAGFIYLVATPNIFAMSSSVSNVDASLVTGPIIPQPSQLTIGD